MAINCGTCETNPVTDVRTCTYSDIVWRLFYKNCAKTAYRCSGKANAYVPATTVCSQRLFY